MAQLNRDAEYSGRRQTKGPSADSIGATPTTTPYQITVWRQQSRACYPRSDSQGNGRGSMAAQYVNYWIFISASRMP
jgi:hypothetical protein